MKVILLSEEQSRFFVSVMSGLSITVGQKLYFVFMGSLSKIEFDFRVPRPTVAPPPPPASGASSPLTESKNLEPPQRVPAGESTSGLSPDAEISYVPSLENTNSTHF